MPTCSLPVGFYDRLDVVLSLSLSFPFSSLPSLSLFLSQDLLYTRRRGSSLAHGLTRSLRPSSCRPCVLCLRVSCDLRSCDSTPFRSRRPRRDESYRPSMSTSDKEPRLVRASGVHEPYPTASREFNGPSGMPDAIKSEADRADNELNVARTSGKNPSCTSDTEFSSRRTMTGYHVERRDRRNLEHYYIRRLLHASFVSF